MLSEHQAEGATLLYTFEVRTNQRTEMIEITSSVRRVVREQGPSARAVVVFVPHTTAGCTINENADPDVVRDMLCEINRTIPFHSDYLHTEGNSAAHIKASLFGSSTHILVDHGDLVLGTWQGIYLCEFDGPRTRKVHVQLLS